MKGCHKSSPQIRAEKVSRMYITLPLQRDQEGVQYTCTSETASILPNLFPVRAPQLSRAKQVYGKREQSTSKAAQSGARHSCATLRQGSTMVNPIKSLSPICLILPLSYPISTSPIYIVVLNPKLKTQCSRIRNKTRLNVNV